MARGDNNTDGPMIDPGDSGSGGDTPGSGPTGESGGEQAEASVLDDRIDPALAAGAEASEADESKAGAARAAQLEVRVAELTEALRLAEERLAVAERRWEMERALDAAGAVDAETARLLLERDLLERPDAEIGGLIDGLRGRKPFLFQRVAGVDGSEAPRGLSSLMAEISEDEFGAFEAGLGAMAQRARESGDRRELAAYLAARRGG